MPLGTNGMVPSLSLNYNSRMGNGVAGWGWNVSGLSVISRVGKDLLHDNDVQGVTYDADDNFAFDGQRLLGSMEIMVL